MAFKPSQTGAGAGSVISWPADLRPGICPVPASVGTSVVCAARCAEAHETVLGTGGQPAGLGFAHAALQKPGCPRSPGAGAGVCDSDRTRPGSEGGATEATVCTAPMDRGPGRPSPLGLRLPAESLVPWAVAAAKPAGSGAWEAGPSAPVPLRPPILCLRVPLTLLCLSTEAPPPVPQLCQTERPGAGGGRARDNNTRNGKRPPMATIPPVGAAVTPPHTHR